jgi:uncharacterized protein (DUF924 family)
MHEEILDFWFVQTQPKQWWVKDARFDELITSRFAEVHAQATRCELFEWRQEPRGRLAEVIVLDQFSRNMFRGSGLAFAYDPLALALAQEAIAAGADQGLTTVERTFLYMPFMHSESLMIHELSIALFESNGVASNLDFALKHQAVIERFGRYPHRNEALGRASTAEELEYIGTTSGF